MTSNTKKKMQQESWRKAGKGGIQYSGEKERIRREREKGRRVRGGGEAGTKEGGVGKRSREKQKRQDKDRNKEGKIQESGKTRERRGGGVRTREKKATRSRTGQNSNGRAQAAAESAPIEEELRGEKAGASRTNIRVKQNLRVGHFALRADCPEPVAHGSLQ